ncbi:hypothetical protein JQ580_05370 [Bradyrhizobium japonicum]|uniref:hypothetical protein n=1 Tax=Bradyrhizobium japonicum TaxID=375 RepID=UPI001BAAE529|nr:hypothetical protein [Bradyrhizobium japonicum]MBR0990144.1 hypothetical protein [Bradyrhizobium japonicum]
MESIEAYLERKHCELRLLNDCLSHRLDLTRPRSVDEVVAAKFRITAALRAEHELQAWKATETSWSHAAKPVSGPFEFRYDYQRADLTVRGPSFYELDSGMSEAIYTASGMAAISAVLLASAQIVEKADLLVLPGSYGETLELIEGLVPHLRLVALSLPLGDAFASANSPKILLLDSCSLAGAFEAAVRSDGSGLDLVIFDTTCFAGSSGRIRRVLSWARRYGIPLVLARSHNKLDSLGAEYGRLGSAVFVRGDDHRQRSRRPEWTRLEAETRNAVRLLGGAALPAHFPPFVGSATYWALTKRRVAAILRNGRSTARYFAARLPALSSELHFAHGLYVTLRGRRPLDEASARQAAEDMSNQLRAEGFPIRHAGSFGFDFAATEWFHDATTDQYSVRVAVSDLPTQVWDGLTAAIVRWWQVRQARGGEG